MSSKRDLWITVSALSAAIAAETGEVEAATDETTLRKGVASYIKSPVVSSAVGKPTRRLRIGDNVFSNEKIKTGAAGQAQILMMDKTTLTIAPNSELIIDEYHYDSEARDGDMTITALKGVFRFVGGQVSKYEPIKVNVPKGTLGIRGAIAVIELNDNGSVSVTFLYGDQVSYSPDDGSEGTEINAGGTVLTINPDGSFTVEPASPEHIAAMQEKLVGPKGSTLVTVPVSDDEEVERTLELLGDDMNLNITILEEILELPEDDFEVVREHLEDMGDTGSGGMYYR